MPDELLLIRNRNGETCDIPKWLFFRLLNAAKCSGLKVEHDHISLCELPSGESYIKMTDEGASKFSDVCETEMRRASGKNRTIARAVIPTLTRFLRVGGIRITHLKHDDGGKPGLSF